MSKKNIFAQNYVGPRGVHLACLTSTTLFGEYEGSKQKSIHTLIGGRRVKKKGTSAPRNPNKKGYLERALQNLNRRQRDCASSCEDIKKNPTTVYSEGMFTMPGSMQL